MGLQSKKQMTHTQQTNKHNSLCFEDAGHPSEGSCGDTVVAAQLKVQMISLRICNITSSLGS